MASDLTILFITASYLPKEWAEYQKSVLLKSAGDSPIITISREPLDWGINLIDDKPRSISNIYYQMLQGAKMATTDYVAVVEDDTLYPYEHFHSKRPPLDAFTYNINRLGLFTWGKPTYHWKSRQSNSTLIAPRLLLIECLEERFAKYPEGTPVEYTGEVGRKLIERKLGLKHYNSEEFMTEVSVVRLDHTLGTDTLAISGRKAMGVARSFDIPHWGRAEDIVAKFK